MSKILSFLIIDDERSIVLSLKTLISKSFRDSVVYEAYNGVEGWEQIERHHPSIVLCDLNMPQMNGLQLLKKVRLSEQFNDIYFMILTANMDRQQRILGLEEGADDFVNKPFSAEELMARLRSASRFVQLQNQTKEENQLLHELAIQLEQSFHDMTLLAIKFLQARIPASTDMLKRVADASIWIAKQLESFDADSIQDLRIAAYLCYSGKISLPDELLKLPVMQDGRPTNKLMFQVPVSAREIVSSVSRFKEVGEYLYRLWENFDGSGFPDRLQSWQIPMASRVLRVALDYEEIKLNSKLPSREVIEKLQRETNRLYDPKCVVLMDQYIAASKSDDSGIHERAVQLQELEEGMVLSREIVSSNGMKLMPAGAVLHDNIIRKIFSLNSTDPILGYIFVKE